MKQSTIKAEFHCHTVYSPDSLVELETLLKACDERGIDKIAITDHGCLQGALKAYQLDPERVIVAEEIETPEGELLGYFGVGDSDDVCCGGGEAEEVDVAVPHN